YVVLLEVRLRGRQADGATPARSPPPLYAAASDEVADRIAAAVVRWILTIGSTRGTGSNGRGASRGGQECWLAARAPRHARSQRGRHLPACWLGLPGSR